MKMRFSVICIIIFALLLIFVIIMMGRRRSDVAKPVQTVDTNTAASLVVSAQAVTNPGSQPTILHSSRLQSPAPSAETHNKGANILSTYNDVPIDFYGRLVDQFNNAVDGARVDFQIRIINGSTGTVERASVVSDASGSFSILGYRGQDLGITPKKEGYIISQTSTLFKFSRLEDQPFVSDSQNPAVIKMWKLQGAEPLAQIDKSLKLPYQASPIFIDLITGESVPAGGDLKITVDRPDGVISARNYQPWDITVEVLGGGYIETSPQELAVSFAAPSIGYQSVGTFTNNNGPDMVDQSLFIKSRNGQMYTKMRLLFNINQTPDGFMVVSFNGVANTNGSGNWEASIPTQN